MLITECIPVISTNLIGNRQKSSFGRLLPNCEANIVKEEIDKTNDSLPPYKWIHNFIIQNTEFVKTSSK